MDNTASLRKKAERYEQVAQVQDEVARAATSEQRREDYRAAAHYWRSQAGVLRRVAQRRERETW